MKMKESRVKNGIIINDTVKMEWQASGYLEVKGKGAHFVVASKVYDSADGVKIPVFFTTNSAFLWADYAGTEQEDLWSVRDLIEWIKKEGEDSHFPAGFDDNYIPIIVEGADVCIDEQLEKYGLTAFKADIEERLADVRQFVIYEDDE